MTATGDLPERHPVFTNDLSAIRVRARDSFRDGDSSTGRVLESLADIGERLEVLIDVVSLTARSAERAQPGPGDRLRRGERWSL